MDARGLDMMKKAAFFAVAAFLAGSIPARGQELTAAPFAATLAQIRAIKLAAPLASAPSAVPASEPISYSGMAQSFDSAPSAPLSALLGNWLQIADASSPDEPGRYDPKGFPDWLYRVAGLEVDLIPAKPPIQDKDGYQVVWGGYGPKTNAFEGFYSAELVPNALGGILHVSGHYEDNPITCGNCPDQGDTQHWVSDHVYEFHLVGEKKDFLIERVTSGGSFDAKTGAVSGGDVSYAGFSKR
jgi:hypothetical protein